MDVTETTFVYLVEVDSTEVSTEVVDVVADLETAKRLAEERIAQGRTVKVHWRERLLYISHDDIEVRGWIAEQKSVRLPLGFYITERPLLTKENL